MALRGTILAGVAALMLSSSMADAKLTEVLKTRIGPEITLGTQNCLKRAGKGDIIAVHLKLKIDEESPFGERGLLIGDSRKEEKGKPSVYKLGEPGKLLPALEDALMGACGGESFRLRIPSKDAYGTEGMGAVPAKADVEFEVEVVDVMPADEVKKYGPPEGNFDAYVKVVYRDAAHNKPDCSRKDRNCGEKYENMKRPPRHHKAKFVVNDFVSGTADNGMFEDKKVYPVNYFETMDEDQDGWVTKKEYKSFIEKTSLKWNFWKLVFEEDDVNKDDRLSWEEFGSPKGVQPPQYSKASK